MKKAVLLFIFFPLLFFSANAFGNNTIKTSSIAQMDDEYNMFKKQGDSLFRQSEYNRALKKYLACLEVPGFNEDKYAKKQVSLCEKAIQLLAEVDIALTSSKYENAKKYLKEILLFNPEDRLVKDQIANILMLIGKNKMSEKLYSEAKIDFEESLNYDSILEVITLIKECEEKIKEEATKKEKIIPQPKITTTTVSKGTPLKIIVGVVCLGSLGYAQILNNNWAEKKDAIQYALGLGNVNNYLTAYDDAIKYQSNQGLRNTCIGISIVAALVEGYLFSVKPQNSKPKIAISPSNTSWGLSLNYHF